MKIDVEGHELEVLRGAEKTISALHSVIISWASKVSSASSRRARGRTRR